MGTLLPSPPSRQSVCCICLLACLFGVLFCLFFGWGGFGGGGGVVSVSGVCMGRGSGSPVHLQTSLWGRCCLPHHHVSLFAVSVFLFVCLVFCFGFFFFFLYFVFFVCFFFWGGGLSLSVVCVWGGGVVHLYISRPPCGDAAAFPTITSVCLLYLSSCLFAWCFCFFVCFFFWGGGGGLSLSVVCLWGGGVVHLYVCRPPCGDAAAFPTITSVCLLYLSSCLFAWCFCFFVCFFFWGGGVVSVSGVSMGRGSGSPVRLQTSLWGRCCLPHHHVSLFAVSLSVCFVFVSGVCMGGGGWFICTSADLPVGTLLPSPPSCQSVCCFSLSVLSLSVVCVWGRGCGWGGGGVHLYISRPPCGDAAAFPTITSVCLSVCLYLSSPPPRRSLPLPFLSYFGLFGWLGFFFW